MMKIVLLKKEYIGLYIYIYTKFCSHILRPTMCEIPPVYGNNKQTNYRIFYERLSILFFHIGFFREYYTILYLM
jgi:hypothetical protein